MLNFDCGSCEVGPFELAWYGANSSDCMSEIALNEEALFLSAAISTGKITTANLNTRERFQNGHQIRCQPKKTVKREKELASC